MLLPHAFYNAFVSSSFCSLLPFYFEHFYFDLSLEWEEKKKHCSIKERMLGPIGRRPGFGS